MRELGLKALFVIILGLALGISGPYGTYSLVPLPIRLGFWVAVILIPWALWESLMFAAQSILPKTLGRRTLMALLMPAFAVVGSLFATSFSAATFGLNEMGFAQAWSQSLISWLLFSFLFVLPLVLITDALSRQQNQKGAENLLGFFSTKIPEHLRGATLIALQSEGHYLRVYTASGDALVHMSMDDALSALSAYPGIRTHRSWWIALGEIDREALDRTPLNAIRSQSGLEVPVSRRRRKAVREQALRARADGSSPHTTATP